MSTLTQITANAAGYSRRTDPTVIRLDHYTPLHVGASPISATCLLCLGRANAFVKISVVCSGSLTLRIWTTPFSTRSLIQCHFVAMCFAFLWNWGFFAIAMHPLLSQLMTVEVSWGHTNSSYRCLNQLASSPASLSPTYS